jgi:hypothetical protein
MIEGGMKVYAREQSAYHTPTEQTCAGAVCVIPERDLRVSYIIRTHG